MPPSPSSSPASTSEGALIRVRGLTTRIAGKVLHDRVDLDVRPGEVMGVVGASGSGKSVLLRTIIGLMEADAGTVEIFGRELRALDESRLRTLEARWGVLFQDGALFSSLFGLGDFAWLEGHGTNTDPHAGTQDFTGGNARDQGKNQQERTRCQRNEGAAHRQRSAGKLDQRSGDPENRRHTNHV